MSTILDPNFGEVSHARAQGDFHGSTPENRTGHVPIAAQVTTSATGTLPCLGEELQTAEWSCPWIADVVQIWPMPSSQICACFRMA